MNKCVEARDIFCLSISILLGILLFYYRNKFSTFQVAGYNQKGASEMAWLPQ